MIINPYILQKIRPYINPHLTNPCIQKHSNNETILHMNMSTRLITTQVNCSKTCVLVGKKSKQRKIKIKELLKVKLNSTHVQVCNYVLVKVFKIIFSYVGSLIIIYDIINHSHSFEMKFFGKSIIIQNSIQDTNPCF